MTQNVEGAGCLPWPLFFPLEKLYAKGGPLGVVLCQPTGRVMWSECSHSSYSSNAVVLILCSRKVLQPHSRVLGSSQLITGPGLPAWGRQGKEKQQFCEVSERMHQYYWRLCKVRGVWWPQEEGNATLVIISSILTLWLSPYICATS